LEVGILPITRGIVMATKLGKKAGGNFLEVRLTGKLVRED